MSNQVINICEILKEESAIIQGQGTVVYEKICSSFESNKDASLCISFDGLKYITTAFLNASIGKFLMTFPEKKSQLIFEANLEENLLLRLNRTIRLATNESERNVRDEITEEMMS